MRAARNVTAVLHADFPLWEGTALTSSASDFRSRFHSPLLFFDLNATIEGKPVSQALLLLLLLVVVVVVFPHDDECIFLLDVHKRRCSQHGDSVLRLGLSKCCEGSVSERASPKLKHSHSCPPQHLHTLSLALSISAGLTADTWIVWTTVCVEE